MNLSPRPLFESHVASPRSIGFSTLNGGATIAPPTSTPYEYQGPTAIISRPSPPISTVGTYSSPQLPIGVPRANPVSPVQPIVQNGGNFQMNYSGTGGSLGTPVAAPVRVSPRLVGSGLFA